MIRLVVLFLSVMAIGCGGSEDAGPTLCEQAQAAFEQGMTDACEGYTDCCLCDCWADHLIPDPNELEDGNCYCVTPTMSCPCTSQVENCIEKSYNWGYDNVVNDCT